ncbi:MAG: DsbA family protein [Paracoccaceae bacterium]|jgi:protein-disulfide isomerase|nr:DsbA family protein [Paracoccaceae bacterium]
MIHPFRALTLSAALSVMALTAPAQAFDVTNMTEDERAALREEIRSYLLDNPEVIMEAVSVLEQRQAEAQAQGDVELVRVNAQAIFEDGHSWVGGNPDGDITLVEFTDYRCGFCRRAHPEVEQLLEADGNIRFILKEFPILGEESVLSSRFAIAVKQIAGDEAYKAAHDALISYRGNITPEALERIAGELDLDAAAIMPHMTSDEVTEVIAANHALAGRLQITGTPTFILEDQMLRGYMPLADMQTLVAQTRQE